MAKIIKNTTPRQDGFYMPAEYAPQEKIWMIWPERPDNWRQGQNPHRPFMQKWQKQSAYLLL